MNNRIYILLMTSTALLMGLVWSGNALAQQGATEMPDPELDRASCEEVNWHQDMLRKYPWVAQGCREAIVVDGRNWARFEAEFQQLNRDGSITSNFRSDRGRSLGNVRLMPGENQRVLLDGRPREFSDLRRGQVLNFYAPDDMFAFTTTPGAPDNEMARVVESDEDEQPTRRMAQAQPDSGNRPTTLPATAGPLPMVAFGGLLSLMGGIALRLVSRRRRASA